MLDSSPASGRLWQQMAVDYDGDDDLENEVCATLLTARIRPRDPCRDCGQDDLLNLSDVSKSKMDCGTGVRTHSLHTKSSVVCYVGFNHGYVRLCLRVIPACRWSTDN